MNAPPALYAIGLVALMDQQGVHRFEVDLTADPESHRGLALEFELSAEKLVVSTGKCDCPACLAATGQKQ